MSTVIHEKISERRFRRYPGRSFIKFTRDLRVVASASRVALTFAIRIVHLESPFVLLCPSHRERLHVFTRVRIEARSLKPGHFLQRGVLPLP